MKEDKEFNLHFTTQNCTSDLDVRLGFDLCPEEEAFLKKRKKVTAAAFKKILQLEDDLEEDEENPHKLSGQQQALSDGQNPLPIYLCLNVKEKLSNQGFRDCDLDSFPNQLIGAEEHLYLVDNAFALDTSYPPLMRPERKVDVFIHLNYSSGSQLRPLQMASDYFSEQGIPFPRIIPQEQDEKDVKECYLLGEQEGPNIPLVLLYPLVCNTFQNYKEPGVKRSPEEMNDGDIDTDTPQGCGALSDSWVPKEYPRFLSSAFPPNDNLTARAGSYHPIRYKIRAFIKSPPDPLSRREGRRRRRKRHGTWRFQPPPRDVPPL
ncbi:cytosolic phospholipase A2 epsilon-like [Crotalus adamanteus]|uniref:Cytosolic phospholipase A2 epsilon-like n=1 Tax=Crotalus adamanteus TaxID=8729 RepID=A0AAW1C5U7_CROAD